MRFGVNRVFKMEKRGGYYIITLKDAKMFLLTHKQVESITLGDNLIFSRYADVRKKKELQKLKTYVNLCFAVMVKYLEEYGFKGKKYKRNKAKSRLLNGFNTDFIYQLLGLKMKTGKVVELNERQWPQLKKRRATLFYSDVHVLVLSKGYWDNYGTATKLNDEVPELGGEKAAYWYEIR